jgi:hypothetical protein
MHKDKTHLENNAPNHEHTVSIGKEILVIRNAQFQNWLISAWVEGFSGVKWGNTCKGTLQLVRCGENIWIHWL